MNAFVKRRQVVKEVVHVPHAADAPIVEAWTVRVEHGPVALDVIAHGPTQHAVVHGNVLGSDTDVLVPVPV
jgi:hypothetical protein